MPLTNKDLNEILKEATQLADSKHPQHSSYSQLIHLMTECSLYVELIREIPLRATSVTLQQGKDIEVALSYCGQLGTMSGLGIGYLLGLREAGLLMGIDPKSPEEES